MAQGLSVGGEYGTAATYMSEIAGKGNRGFYSSFQYVTLIGGQLLALLVVLVLQQTLSLDELKAWGWRVPFLIGAVAALVALYLRRSLQETASAETMNNKEAGSLSGLWHHKRALLFVLAFTIGGSLYFYTFTTYMQKFLVNSVKMDAKTVSSIMTAALIAFMLHATGVRGSFGQDRPPQQHDPLQCMRNVRSGPAPDDIVQHHRRLRRLCSDHGGSCDCVFYTSISGVVKAELFPPEVRALGVGLPYAIANAMFGGTAEYVALSLKSAGYEYCVLLVRRGYGACRPHRVALDARYTEARLSRRRWPDLN